MILGGWVDVGHDGRFGVAEVLNGGGCSGYGCRVPMGLLETEVPW